MKAIRVHRDDPIEEGDSIFYENKPYEVIEIFHRCGDKVLSIERCDLPQKENITC